MTQLQMDQVTYPHMNDLLHWMPRLNEAGELKIPKISIEEKVINRTIAIELKRDGSNTGIYIDNADTPQVRTRNQNVAFPEVSTRLMKVPNAIAAVNAAKICNAAGVKMVIFGEWLSKGKSPAKFEVHNTDEWLVFDIYNASLGQWMDFDAKMRFCDQFGIEHVPVIDHINVSCTTDLFAMRDYFIDYCHEHSAEGVVGKVYVTGANGQQYINFFKEKQEEIHITRPTADEDPRPELPESEIRGAIDKALMELGIAQFSNIKTAMPVVAKMIDHECDKHGCRMLRKPTYYYKERLSEMLAEAGAM